MPNQEQGTNDIPRETLTWGQLRRYAEAHAITDETPVLCQVPDSIEAWPRIAYSFPDGHRDSPLRTWSAIPPFQPFAANVAGTRALVIEVDY
jgi:hypothetical protein